MDKHNDCHGYTIFDKEEEKYVTTYKGLEDAGIGIAIFNGRVIIKTHDKSRYDVVPANQKQGDLT